MQDFDSILLNSVRTFLIHKRRLDDFKHEYQFNLFELGYHEIPFNNALQCINLASSYDNLPFDQTFASFSMNKPHKLYFTLFCYYEMLVESLIIRNEVRSRKLPKRVFTEHGEEEIRELEKVLGIPKEESYFNFKNINLPYRTNNMASIEELLGDDPLMMMNFKCYIILYYNCL
jgi:hypothetical protein